MSYDPTTDFLGLSRRIGFSVVNERMPGLDYVVVALARAGLINVSVGQTAPLANQATTAWLQPAEPSWTAEGVVRLWDGANYVPATPGLWQVFLAPNQYVFQSAAGATNVVKSNTSLLAVQRAGPALTALVLPALVSRLLKPLQIVDWSSAVVNHEITISTTDGATIMKSASWGLLSTADQLAGVTLRPAPELNAWVITP